jgi:hypothetical protein
MAAPAHTRLPIRMLIGLLVIILAAVAGWLYFSTQTNVQNQNPSVVLPGLLLMSIEAQPVQGWAPRVFPVQYDPQIGDFLTPPVSDLATDKAGAKVAYEHRLSDNERWITFLGAVGLNGLQDTLSAVPLQVYRTDISAATYETVTPMIQHAEQITSDATVKQLPAISDSGDVVYMARSAGTTRTDANSWGMYLIPAGGDQPRFLSDGVSPQWLDAKSILYLSNDGLRTLNVQTGYTALVWGVRSTIPGNAVLSFSRDKHFIVASFPDIAKTYVFRSLSGNATDLTLHGEIDGPASYAVIAPDDSSVALQMPKPSLTGNTFIPAILFFDLETLQQLPETVDIMGAYANLQKSFAANLYKGNMASTSTHIAVLVDTLEPSSVVLTDWIP